MKTIDPVPGAFGKTLAGIPKGVPIVMLNLLKFREQAQYLDASEPPCSGREAYERYGSRAIGAVKAIGGEVLWYGSAVGSLIAPPDESWDEILLVRYPSIDAFVKIMMASEYQAFAKHRTAALEDARLVATVATSSL